MSFLCVWDGKKWEIDEYVKKECFYAFENRQGKSTHPHVSVEGPTAGLEARMNSDASELEKVT